MSESSNWSVDGRPGGTDNPHGPHFFPNPPVPMNRPPAAALCLACLTAFGCVEGEQTYTLNPDGTGKVKFDVTLPAPVDPVGGGPKKGGREETPDSLRRKAAKQLLETPQVDAWKDVTLAFTPDGRLKLAGTAYFRNAAAFEIRNTAFLNPEFALDRQPDGSLALARRKKPVNSAPGVDLTPDKPRKTHDEIAKLTDKELDDLILRDRIEYQSSKGLIIAMFTDLKLKTVFVLPGDVKPGKGFKAEGKNSVSYTLDGDRLLGGMKKFFAQDDAALRKAYRANPGGIGVETVLRDLAGIPDDDVKMPVGKAAGPLFDYEKEVKEARAAYPALREKLGVDDLKLPEGSDPKADPKKP